VSPQMALFFVGLAAAKPLTRNLERGLKMYSVQGYSHTKPEFCSNHDWGSKFGVILPVNGYSSKLIASYARRPAFVNPILPLNDLTPGLRHVRREGKEQVLGNALLDGNAR
jgi:hypothetical protein